MGAARGLGGAPIGGTGLGCSKGAEPRWRGTGRALREVDGSTKAREIVYPRGPRGHRLPILAPLRCWSSQRIVRCRSFSKRRARRVRPDGRPRAGPREVFPSAGGAFAPPTRPARARAGTFSSCAEPHEAAPAAPSSGIILGPRPGAQRAPGTTAARKPSSSAAAALSSSTMCSSRIWRTDGESGA